jgi:hypothetical protein
MFFSSSSLLLDSPYGAVDISANMKGAISKITTQKILLALTEKGELTQKTHGIVSFPALLILSPYSIYVQM